jgi:sigma-B regulation protein RsbU (phosphoserine phosphatase)
MENKRLPIRKNVQRMVLTISVGALMLTSIISLFSMLKIQSDILNANKNLGSTTSQDSENALLKQTEANLLDLVTNKSELADSELGQYQDDVSQFAAYAHTLYQNPDKFIGVETDPPDKTNKDQLIMQRYLADQSVSLSSVQSELTLLGNLEYVFSPVISAQKDMITTIYAGTKDGLLLTCDSRSDLGDATPSWEEYYEYRNSAWYTGAQSAGQAFFTETYLDSYGRGLTITCAAPFYDADNQFAGVIGMDILITDLNKSITNIDVGENSYALLIDKDGKVIASPQMTADTTEFTDIMTDTTLPAYEVRDQIMSGNTGVVLTKAGIYYAYAPITAADWTLAIHVQASDITQAVTQVHDSITSITTSTAATMRQNILGSILVFLISCILIVALVALLSGRFADNLVKPLLLLRDDVGQIAGGNLDHRAEIHSNDEIGDLAGAFNSMTISLEKYIRDLTAVTAEKQRIGAELDVARQIQSSMLPCIFPAFPDRCEFDIYATMNPAKEVGGDFYDFFMVDDTHLAIVVADVSGKGVPAALFMVIGKALIKDHTQQGKDLGQVFTEVNDLLCESNSEGLFITAFEGVLDFATGEFQYVNAGHEMPYISHAGGRFEALHMTPGFVLAGMAGMKYKHGTITLQPGDKIFQYTDGVTEATSAQQELYGKDRLEAVLNTVNTCTPAQILPAVKQSIDGFVKEAPQFDDITMLCLEYKARGKNTGGGDMEKEMTIDATVDNVEKVTEFVNQQLAALGCSDKVQMQFDIAIDELFSNIALYAYHPKTGKATIAVSVEKGPLTAAVTLKDNGKPYNPLAKEDPDVTLSAEDREVGGLGIFMVKKTMDDVTYDFKDGQNVVTIRKKL